MQVSQFPTNLATMYPLLPSIQDLKKSCNFTVSTTLEAATTPPFNFAPLPPLRVYMQLICQPMHNPYGYESRDDSADSSLPTPRAISSPSPSHSNSDSSHGSVPSSRPSPVAYSSDYRQNKKEGSCSSWCTDETREKHAVFTGVSRSGVNGRWRAQLSTKGKTVHLGTFPTSEEAARAWDRAAVLERGADVLTNFDIADYVNSDGSLKKEVLEEDVAKMGSKGKSKEYRGVYNSGTYGRWKARIVINGQKIHLGTYSTAAEAARAWDLKAIEQRGGNTVTNFDLKNYADHIAQQQKPLKADPADSQDRKQTESEGNGDGGSSGYRGIYARIGTGKWVARLRSNRQSVYIGSYSTAKQAAHAWDLAALRERGMSTETNFDKSIYLKSDGTLMSTYPPNDGTSPKCSQHSKPATCDVSMLMSVGEKRRRLDGPDDEE